MRMVLDPPVLRVVFFNLLVAGVCGYAIRRGGAPERITGWLFVAAAVLTALAAQWSATRYLHLEIGIFLVDMLVLIVLGVVAMRADRFWPLVLAAMQLDTLIVHFLKLVDADLIRLTYALMIGMWGYPMLLILAIGTARHRSRLRRFGEDRAWSVRFSH